MKKLVLTMVALVAMATTNFAQYSDFEQMCSKVINDFYSSQHDNGQWLHPQQWHLCSESCPHNAQQHKLGQLLHQGKQQSLHRFNWLSSQRLFKRRIQLWSRPHNPYWFTRRAVLLQQQWTQDLCSKEEPVVKIKFKQELGASEKLPLILIYPIQQNECCPILRFVKASIIIFP